MCFIYFAGIFFHLVVIEVVLKMKHIYTKVIISSQKIFTIEANFNLSENVVKYIMDSYKKYFFSQKIFFQINMIIDEIFGNISRYAFGNKGGEVIILSWIEKDPLRLYIRFVDKGIQFNPLEIKEPDTTSSIDNRKIGGIGVFIVKSMVDSIAYKYIYECNVLTIVKFLN